MYARINTGKQKKQVVTPDLWHSCVLFLVRNGREINDDFFGNSSQ